MVSAAIWAATAAFLLGWCIVTIALIDHLVAWPTYFHSATRRGKAWLLAGVTATLLLYLGFSVGLSALLTYWWEEWM